MWKIRLKEKTEILYIFILQKYYNNDNRAIKNRAFYLFLGYSIKNEGGNDGWQLLQDSYNVNIYSNISLYLCFLRTSCFLLKKYENKSCFYESVILINNVHQCYEGLQKEAREGQKRVLGVFGGFLEAKGHTP